MENGKYVELTEDLDAEANKTAPYGNKYALKQDGGVVDLSKNEINFECYGDDYGIMTYGGTIKNGELSDIARAIVIMSPTEDVIIDNVVVKEDVLYPLNTAEHATVPGLKLIARNSTFGGWTSFDGGFESASFTNCKFVFGNYYNSWPYDSLVKPYINTVFENCDFADTYYLDLSSLNTNAKITFKNCTVNGQPLTAAICGFNCDGTETFCVELPGDGRTLADCVIFE